jgi:PAS domain-containing protein
MTHPRRLALAMILLVAATSCVVSAVAWYLVTQALPGGAVTTIGSAAAGGAIGSLFAMALVAGLAKFMRNPLLGDGAAPETPGVNDEPEQKRAHQTLIDNEKMARAIIEGALDAFVQTDENCIVLNWSPHACFRNRCAYCTGNGSTSF